MAAETPLDRFKAVLTGAARAIADEPEVELAFTADAPAQSGKHLKVPMPARQLPAEQVAEARGFADGFALRLKHHDTTLHLRTAPGEAVARAVFDAVEQVLPLPRVAQVASDGAIREAGVGAVGLGDEGVDADDLVAALPQPPADRGADEPGAAGEQDPHGPTSDGTA